MMFSVRAATVALLVVGCSASGNADPDGVLQGSAASDVGVSVEVDILNVVQEGAETVEFVRVPDDDVGDAEFVNADETAIFRIL